MEAKI